jgi:uncharacterized 2Fe-2S/4Fe-4S cluster protein (DUF4445 family)
LTISSYTIDFEPVGRRVQVGTGSTLLAAAQAAGVELVAVCGGIGSCGTCRVRLMTGELSPPTLVEEAELGLDEIAAGFRLACQASPGSDVRLDIPPESLTTPQRLQVEGQGVAVGLDPVVVPIDLHISPPSLFDLRSDTTRLKAALAEHGFVIQSIALPVLVGLPEDLRAQDWSARLALRRVDGKAAKNLVAVLPPGSPLLGLAVDIGTTKLAAYLVDLVSGKTLAKDGAMNPQIAFGEDVISRIAYANEHAEGHPDGRQLLQDRLVATVNGLAAQLCAGVDSSPEQIVEAVFVGNTAMHHLFAGLPVRQLGASPYVPVIGESFELPAAALGLSLSPGAMVYLPPNIAGYVGADHVAMLLAMDVARTQQITIALDIGTNTEITLSIPARRAGRKGNRLLSCSCASGPAFEGAHINAGMRAAPGAIERLQIIAGEVRVHTIGAIAPVGICGSGILDAVAELLVAGVLDRRGVLQQGHPRLRQATNGRLEFLLVPAADTGHGHDLVVSREDVKEIQLAKGAIRAGIEILLGEAGLMPDDVEQFIIAGAFGTYLDLNSALRIGMFPSLPIERFRQVGNAAGIGARQMLVSAAQRRAASQIARQIEYIELTTHPTFAEEFVQAISFGK